MERLYFILNITKSEYVKSGLYPAIFTYSAAVSHIYKLCKENGYQELEFELQEFKHNIQIKKAD